MKMKSLSYKTYLDRKKIRRERTIKIRTERKFNHEESDEYLEAIFGSKSTVSN